MSCMTYTIGIALEANASIALRGRIDVDSVSSNTESVLLWHPWMPLAVLFAALLVGAILLARKLEGEIPDYGLNLLDLDHSRRPRIVSTTLRRDGRALPHAAA